MTIHDPRQRPAILPFLLAVLCVLAAGAAGARAAERWTSDYGDVAYMRDSGDWAVWSFVPVGGSEPTGRIFIRGLAGVSSGRGEYTGYWMYPNGGDTRCATSLRAADGTESRSYGAFRITFLDPVAPSRWIAKWGSCDQPPELAWHGTPVSDTSGTCATEPDPACPQPSGQSARSDRQSAGEDQSVGAGSGGPGWAGLSLEDVSADVALALGLSSRAGALVAVVAPDGPAASAGIMPGDVIVGLDGARISDSAGLARRLSALRAGRAVDLDLIRNGRSFGQSVVLAGRPDTYGPEAMAAENGGGAACALSGDDAAVTVSGPLAMMPLSCTTRTLFDIPLDVTGAVITAVGKYSDAASRGLSVGDVITWVDGKSIRGPGQASVRMLAAKSAGSGRVLMGLRTVRGRERAAAPDLNSLGTEGRSLLTHAGLAYDQGTGGRRNSSLSAVHLLAAYAGGEPEARALLETGPDRLARATRVRIQERLSDAGLYRGRIDADIGPATRRALSGYRPEKGLLQHLMPPGVR